MRMLQSIPRLVRRYHKRLDGKCGLEGQHHELVQIELREGSIARLCSLNDLDSVQLCIIVLQQPARSLCVNRCVAFVKDTKRVSVGVCRCMIV